MAGTIAQGNISTEEVLPDERVVDMDEKIRKLTTDDAQFTTMTDRADNRTAVREKVNWLEEEDFPRIVSAAGAQTAGSGALVLTAGQGKLIQPGDVLRNMRTGQADKILTASTDTLTVANAINGGATSAVNSGDAYLVVADAQPQGSDFPTMRYLARVLGFNYTQITRTPWTFTGTTTAIELYGGREPAKEAVRKAREHKRKWEAIGFFGARSFLANSGAAPAGNGEPIGTAGGAIEFIQTNRGDMSAGFTPVKFDNWIMPILPYGDPGSKVLFASPQVAANFSSWVRQGQGLQWQPSPENVMGVKVDAFISGAYGYKIPVVVKKEWSQFPTTGNGYGTYAFLLDMSLVQQIPLRDRDTKLLTEQQPKGKDTYAAEYMREATWEFAHERAHGLIFGVPAATV